MSVLWYYYLRILIVYFKPILRKLSNTITNNIVSIKIPFYQQSILFLIQLLTYSKQRWNFYFNFLHELKYFVTLQNMRSHFTKCITVNTFILQWFTDERLPLLAKHNTIHTADKSEGFTRTVHDKWFDIKWTAHSDQYLFTTHCFQEERDE